METLNALVDITLALGIAELLSRFGLTGKWNLASSILAVIVLGMLSELTAMNPAAALWINAFFTYLKLALAATGIISTGARLITGPGMTMQALEDRGGILPWM